MLNAMLSSSQLWIACLVYVRFFIRNNFHKFVPGIELSTVYPRIFIHNPLCLCNSMRIIASRGSGRDRKEQRFAL